MVDDGFFFKELQEFLLCIPIAKYPYAALLHSVY